MQSLTVDLPEPLHQSVQSRTTQGGFESISQYLQELIRADQKQAAMEWLENELLKGLDSGDPIPMERKDWDEFREDFRRRHEAS